MLIAREVALDEPQEPDENTEKQHEREDVEHLHPPATRRRWVSERGVSPSCRGAHQTAKPKAG